MSEKTSGLNIFQAFKKIMAVHIIAACTAFLGVVVDSIVVSRFLGLDNMAAFGFAQPAVLITAAFALIFSTGMQAITGKKLGIGDIDGMNRTVSLSVSLAALSGLFFCLVFLLFAEPIVTLFGASGDSIAPAAAYLRGIAPGTVLMMLGPVLTELMQIDSDIPRSFYSVAVMTAVNIFLDIANALWFDGGLFGMALATTISSCFNIGILALHFLRKDRMIRFSVRNLDFGSSGKIFVSGLPSATQQLCIVFRMIVLNILLGSLAGNASVASFTALNGMIPIIMSVINGVGTTVLLVSGVIIGEEDRGSLEKLTKSVFRLGLLLSVLVAAVIVFGSKIIAGFFVSGDEAGQADLVARTFRFYGLSIPFTMITTIFVNYFQSLGKSVLAELLAICEHAGFMLAFAVLLFLAVGTDGVWLSFLCAELLSLLLIASVSFVKNRKISLNILDLLMLDKKFGVSEDNRLNVSAENREEAVLISQKIMDFCLKNGVDRKRALYSGICMEEMAVLALDNSAAQKKDCRVDVYVALKNGDLTVRMKDNGIPFDPNEQHELLNPADPVDHIAIRVFYEMAKDVSYNNLFDLNMLTFRI